MTGRVLPLLLVVALATWAVADDTAPNAQKRSPIGDVGLGSDGSVKEQDNYQVRVGELNAPGGEAYFIPFLIPPIGVGQHVATAHFRFQLFAIDHESSGLANADLYGLGVRDSNKPVAGDYYQGSKPRTDAETGPFIETNAAGDAALAKFLDHAFSQPDNAGKYVVLRISYDANAIPTGNNAYVLLTTGATGDNETPVLTYTLTPAQ